MKYIKQILTVTDEAYKAQRSTVKELNLELDLDKQVSGNKTYDIPNGEKILKPITDIPKLDAPKAVTTLMGGRGYINWRRVAVEKQRTSALAQINNYDAFLVIWEMKL